jgi:hypothetical protein
MAEDKSAPVEFQYDELLAAPKPQLMLPTSSPKGYVCKYVVTRAETVTSWTSLK